MQMQTARTTLTITLISLGILIVSVMKTCNIETLIKKIKGVPIQGASFTDYVQDFVSKRKLYDYGHRLAIGGQLETQYLKNWAAVAPQGQYDVLNIYPCYVPVSAQVTDKFFLAYATAVLDDSMKCGCVMAPMLKVSAGEFKYSSMNTSFDDVDYFLNHEQINEVAAFPPDIPSHEVTNYVTRFLSNYSNDAGVPYNRSYCTAFTKSEIDAILNQKESGVSGFAINGIRYFLGYDSKGSNVDNKIRIILIGFDQNGDNYIKTTAGKAAVMIERAWPPDNCQ